MNKVETLVQAEIKKVYDALKDGLGVNHIYTCRQAMHENFLTVMDDETASILEYSIYLVFKSMDVDCYDFHTICKTSAKVFKDSIRKNTSPKEVVKNTIKEELEIHTSLNNEFKRSNTNG